MVSAMSAPAMPVGSALTPAVTAAAADVVTTTRRTHGGNSRAAYTSPKSVRPAAVAPVTTTHAGNEGDANEPMTTAAASATPPTDRIPTRAPDSRSPELDADRARRRSAALTTSVNHVAAENAIPQRVAITSGTWSGLRARRHATEAPIAAGF